MNQFVENQAGKIELRCLKCEPLVVIQCMVYNHNPYIKDALEGFVMQKTNFPFVAIVHDDASTDGTADIIREYAEKYSNIIIPIFEKENQYSKKDDSLGRIMNEAINATGAKYVAICEGDDYWTDPYKLQKQVDILEANKKLSLTCHRYLWNKYGSFTLRPNTILDANQKIAGFEFSIEDALGGENEWFTKTLTIVYRLSSVDQNLLNKIPYSKDLHLMYSLLKNGNGYCLSDVCGVYRFHDGGVWGRKDVYFKTISDLYAWRNLYRYDPNDYTYKFLKKSYDYTLSFMFRNYRRVIWPISKCEIKIFVKKLFCYFSRTLVK